MADSERLKTIRRAFWVALIPGAIILSLGRAPGILAFPLLTKITPDVVGVWFVVRREWRSALWAADVILRLAAALGMVIWAARTGRA